MTRNQSLFVNFVCAGAIAAATSWSTAGIAGGPMEQPTYSGRATVIDANLKLPVGSQHRVLADTGELDPSGQTREYNSISHDNLAGLNMSVRVLHAITSGANGTAASNATVTKLLINQPGLQLGADVIAADASATCHRESMTVSTAGSSSLTNLRINGQLINAAVPPNTVIPLGAAGSVVLNEQYNPDVNTQAVNAIHVRVPASPGVAAADIIISHAQAGILSCPCD